MIHNQLMESFKKIFHQEEYRTFFAPGRINLIGEHTDYNGGNVFPCAITFGIYALASKRDDALICAYSLNFPEKGVISFSLQELDYKQEHDWANYPKGMIRYLIEAGYSIDSGINIMFYGNIPNGAGLSSSASIELVTGVTMEGLFQFELDRIELVKIGKKVENYFIGVNSGIMDQFAIGMGKARYGMLLNCQTLNFTYAPLQLDNYNIIIMNTNKRRELTASKYNERRMECEQALAKLQEVIDISSLGELTEKMFEQYKHVIKEDSLRKRAKHVVYENCRTLQSVKELKENNIKEFGRLMNESHCSLRDDYEVTGRELDTLVESAWKQEGVIGARMTGAGFGGCAIVIVEKEYTDQFICNVRQKYRDTIGYEATFYVAEIGDGARELQKEAMQ
ncbi:galactokinase [Bacillus pseudomycoides]|uniref:galactokinase n=1 Tax=Bacillus pseudomycoides TaxID=64104 RepID=UPI000BF11679|nr:galactokinase [Bacillus pseudomycoides]PEJ32691.1 galactokinase [Bacillus pseudomycoides]PHA94628.1 galactokinase [Bacillus pseudomycoides]PHC72218.1 galactokinase [Bacillus pseudomycoides]